MSSTVEPATDSVVFLRGLAMSVAAVMLTFVTGNRHGGLC
jgi:hypothetical protein